MLKAIIFDLGNTIIKQQLDTELTIDQLPFELLPGASKVLKILKNNYKLAILSNTIKSKAIHINIALKRVKLNKIFSIITTSVDEKIRKPDPKIFTNILKKLEVYSIEAIMIGNDIDADIGGAKNAGMKTVFYSPLQEDWDKKNSSYIIPDYEISDLSELIRITQDISIRSKKVYKK